MKHAQLSNGNKNNRGYLAFQFLLNLSFALVIIGCFWWLMLLIWIAIKLDSPGPGLFAQERVGRNQKIFHCLKFRTMKNNVPQLGTHEIDKKLVTRVGRILRSTKLDELPQAWNILRGEMVLVGPRPCLPNQLDVINQRQLRRIFEVKPGLTGLSQVCGVDMAEPMLLAQTDESYILRRSPFLDIQILFKTVFGRVFHQNRP